MAFKGKIQVKEGKWTQTCTTDSDLMNNQAKYPALRGILEYADQREISTLLVSGAVGPYGVGQVTTKIGDLSTKKEIGDNAYRFDIMGRIQRPSTINQQVGASQTDGTFQLSMADNNLYPGMNVLFHGQGFQARVMSNPTGGPGNYIYTFKSPDGTVFSWANHVSGQGANKTCFGGYTSYGEGSLRGYGNSFFPDTFIQHTTIQRKACKITGSAASNVLWLEYDGPKGKFGGWYFEQIRQGKAQLAVENEFGKWFGLSTMKDDNGRLLSKSRLQDYETGYDIVMGDGVIPQLAGGNETAGSGVNGEATSDDITDMMTTLEKKSNGVRGLTWLCITGTDGYANAQIQMQNLAGNQNIQIHQMVTQNSRPGGAEVEIGFDYSRFNVNGNSVTFIKHPMWDDETRFTERGADGKLLQSSMMVFMNMGTANGKNCEILAKGANGISRASVEAYINGLSGDASRMVQSSEDAIKYELLREDMICVYNTQSCGIIRKSAN